MKIMIIIITNIVIIIIITSKDHDYLCLVDLDGWQRKTGFAITKLLIITTTITTITTITIITIIIIIISAAF